MTGLEFVSLLVELVVGSVSLILGVLAAAVFVYGVIVAVSEGPAAFLEGLTSWPSKWRLLRDERKLAEAQRRAEIRRELARLQAEEHREALRQLEGL